MLRFDSKVDSIAFGRAGTLLEGLLFVSTERARRRRPAARRIEMVDLATLQRVTVATGGTRGEVLRTTADGRVLVTQSHQVDVLSPWWRRPCSPPLRPRAR